jgi:hypothetical protein
MIDIPATDPGGVGDAMQVEAQGEHEYVVRLQSGGNVVESWVRVTPEILDQLGASEAGEERLVHRTVAFLLQYQDAADFPAVVELEDVLAAYSGYAAAMTS